MEKKGGDAILKNITKKMLERLEQQIETTVFWEGDDRGRGNSRYKNKKLGIIFLIIQKTGTKNRRVKKEYTEENIS